MAEILLVNPRRRRHKRRTLSALQRKFFGKRRKNPSSHRSRKVRRHHYVRNPSFRNVTGAVVPTVKSGAIGAAGGLIADILFGYTKSKLPGALTSSPAVAAATKLVYAVLAGVVGNLVLKGRGQQLAVGAATIAIHDFAKAQLAASMPSLPLGDYLTIAPSVGYNANASGTRALRQSTYSPVGRVGKVGRVGQYMTTPARSAPAMGQYLSDADYKNGIPTTG